MSQRKSLRRRPHTSSVGPSFQGYKDSLQTIIVVNLDNSRYQPIGNTQSLHKEQSISIDSQLNLSDSTTPTFEWLKRKARSLPIPDQLRLAKEIIKQANILPELSKEPQSTRQLGSLGKDESDSEQTASILKDPTVFKPVSLPNKSVRRMIREMPAGRLFKTSAEADEYLEQERDSWDR